MCVDRCLCHGVTFRELKQVADAKEIGELSDLQNVVPFGMNCGLCRPYVRQMLRTGEIAFDYLIDGGEDG
ncbi:MAG: (2Fe-2S)-binding protein [Rhodothermia bacterium]|nr:(2Fe-2S)-binding protein [Rhodothermia bacterium]